MGQNVPNAGSSDAPARNTSDNNARPAQQSGRASDKSPERREHSDSNGRSVPRPTGRQVRNDPRRKKGTNKKQRVFFHRMLMHIPLPKLLTKARYLSAGLARFYIESGRVRINSRPMLSRFYEVNLRKERVTIDDANVEYPRRLFYMVYNKTRDVQCESGDETFNMIFDPSSTWSFPFGRLRKSLSGLVIVSNDPRMIHSHNRIDDELQKEYRVRVNKHLTDEQLNQLRSGIRVADEYLIPLRVDVASQNRKGMLLDITLLDDSYESIFVVLRSLGCEVMQMRRIRIGMINEMMVPPGEWRELASFEVTALALNRFMHGELPPEEEDRFERREREGSGKFGAGRDRFQGKRDARGIARPAWKEKVDLRDREIPAPKPDIGNQIEAINPEPEIDRDKRDMERKKAKEERRKREQAYGGRDLRDGRFMPGPTNKRNSPPAGHDANPRKAKDKLDGPSPSPSSDSGENADGNV